MNQQTQDRLINFGITAVSIIVVVTAVKKFLNIDPVNDEKINSLKYDDPAVNFFNPDFGQLYNDTYNSGNPSIGNKIKAYYNEVNDTTVANFYKNWEFSDPDYESNSESGIIDYLLSFPSFLSGSFYYIGMVLVIKNALGGLTDNEAAVKAVFDHVESQFEVSMIARWFNFGEGKDLLSVLQHGAGMDLPWKGLSSTEIGEIIDRIKQLPVFPLYW